MQQLRNTSAAKNKKTYYLYIYFMYYLYIIYLFEFNLTIPKYRLSKEKLVLITCSQDIWIKYQRESS